MRFVSNKSTIKRSIKQSQTLLKFDLMAEQNEHINREPIIDFVL